MPAATAPARRPRTGVGKLPSLTKTSKTNQRPAARKHTCCSNPLIEDDGEGHLVCRNCYTQVAESNIVADVTFQEDAQGRATVQGGFIGENARHKPGSATMRRIGGSEKDALQLIESNGRQVLSSLCPKLGIPETTQIQALKMYTLAVHHQNFAAGRRTDEVIGACLYAACRRQKDNAILLIDISELQQINVFRLGEVYKSLCAELYLDPKTSGVGNQYLVEVESLVMRYCRRLEFDNATRQVAEDAVKILRRMKRDWITTGRHPSAVCAAAIILAARMNNFRRSIRELVYVAKVADFTIWKRVEEFRRTKSAALTVDQFREYGVRLKHQHDPPILFESQIKQQKFEEKKRNLQAAREARDAIEASENGSNASSREASVATPTPAPEPANKKTSKRKRNSSTTDQPITPVTTQQEPRRDADGFVIPALPAELNAAPDDEEPPAKRKRGRPRKEAPEPIVITDEELATEAELEFDINEALNDEEIMDSRNELEKAKDEERAKAMAERQKKDDAAKNRSRREAEGITWLDDEGFTTREDVTAEDLEAEFANDPEVMNCELSPAEKQVKEQIWLRENEDWLRLQQEKKIMKEMALATKNKKNKAPVKRRRRGKMGDGTTLAEATTPIETPADATGAMLEARASPRVSRFINYEALRRVYGPSSSSPSGSRKSTTPSGSGVSRPGTPAGGDGAGVQGGEAASPTAGSGAQRVRLQTPSQQIGTPATDIMSPSAQSDTAPPSPAAAQAQAGAEEDMESDEDDYVQADEDDYVQPDADEDEYGPRGLDYSWNAEDDREDIGEDDYNRVIDPTSNFAMGGDAMDDDDY